MIMPDKITLFEVGAPYVKQIAQRYAETGLRYQSLVDAGGIGLGRAVNNYHGDTGTFTSIAANAIETAIQRFVKENQ